ncbi:hypothetical protein ACJIZ3_015568 [Penstemon smallii]|uniref:Uncharacterized protein n=1 Tax=Penstemon smallii TaxID=265156 RepID=A0ABD3RMZ7_9LAMI
METPRGAVTEAHLLIIENCSTSSPSSTFGGLLHRECNSVALCCSCILETVSSNVILGLLPRGPRGLGRSLNFRSRFTGDLHLRGD